LKEVNMRMFFAIGAVCAALVGFGPLAAAQGGDSSADASPWFAPTVVGSNGAIIRVPTNAEGLEDSTAAVIHVVTGRPPAREELAAAFEAGANASAQPLHGDSSAHWWGWERPWYGNGWYNAGYYYNAYRPSYYFGGYYYDFGAPYSYAYYGSAFYPYYGCNYYYYPRVW
jgi:hypothetical protein